MSDMPKVQPLDRLCVAPVDVPAGLREQYADLLLEQRQQWQTIPAEKSAEMNDPHKPSFAPKWVAWDTTVNKPDGSQLNLHMYAAPDLAPTILGMDDKKAGQDDRYNIDGTRDAVEFKAADQQRNVPLDVHVSFSRVGKGPSFAGTEIVEVPYEIHTDHGARRVAFTFDETGRATSSKCD